MQLDLLGAVALTAISALIAGVYADLLPWHRTRRAAVLAAFAAWFAVVAICGAAGVFDAVRGAGPAGLGVAVLIPFAILTIASTRAGALRDALGTFSLPVLIGLHAVRILGLFFLLLFLHGRLPAPFAPIAGGGDVLIGLTAIPVAYLVHVKASAWRPVAAIWNTLGLVDLALAIALGVASSPGIPFGLAGPNADTASMTTLPWILIPCFNVPLLAHLHMLIFQRLRQQGLAVVTARV